MRGFLIMAAAVLAASPAWALPAEAWQRDLTALREAYAATHPSPWHKLSRAEFDRMADRLAADIPSLDDRQVMARMIELIAATGEGHTRLTLPLPEDAGVFLGHAKTEAPKLPVFATLPIRLTAASDGYLVTAAAPEYRRLVGAALVSIDGKPVAAIEAAMLPLVNGDNAGMKRAYLPSFIMLPDLLRVRGLTAANEARWRFRFPSGREVEERLSALPDGADLAWAKEPDTPIFGLLPLDGGIVVARISEIGNAPDQSLAAFADKIYAAVDQTPDARLVIDLRGNPGGNNFLIDPVVRGAIARPALWKPGHLFVLIDAKTFSAAQNLVNAMERWTPALLVGEPTGGAPSSYGDSKRITLPESGLTLRVSSLYWQDTGPLDKRDATAPHVAAPRTVADLQTGRDPALAAIALLSRPQGSAQGSWAAPFTYVYRPATLRVRFGRDGGSFAVPELKLAETPFQSVTLNGSDVTATGKVRDSVFTLRAQSTAGGLVGWLDVNGRPYPFVAKRAAE
ncbi:MULTISPECIES: S41 family peptidase [Sphingomonas]|nr:MULTISPECIES: S41 family peptidase [Sphingomonas]MBA2919541.1 hypothetical protein [Sphingomonas sp. CGMCC 1.13658]